MNLVQIGISYGDITMGTDKLQEVSTCHWKSSLSPLYLQVQGITALMHDLFSLLGLKGLSCLSAGRKGKKVHFYQRVEGARGLLMNCYFRIEPTS